MSPYKILVVEDESIAALSLKESLENLAFEVTALASNKAEALDALGHTMPNLVLMDINLEGKEDGIEIGKKILQEKDLPVVFLTAYADKNMVLKAKEAFPYGYIIKPYSEHELGAVIEIAIHKHTADKRQRDLNQLKDKFYSIIAHDLKSPLAALSFTTRLLSRKADELSKEEVKDFIKEIHSTADNLYAFTENMLDWSRSQTGSLTVIPENICLHELVMEVVGLLKAKAKDKGVKFSVNLRDVKVLADKNMLRSILMNLLQNSLKFSWPGGIVLVEAQKMEADVAIWVRDSGVGMTEEQLRNLFDFKRSRHTSGTREEKGTGLGLLLCKEFVEANGGTIEVLSGAEKGTEVKVTLAAARSAE